MSSIKDALPNFAAFLKAHSVSVMAIARAKSMKHPEDLCAALRRGTMERAMIHDINTILQESGYTLPADLWINSEGIDISLPPRPLYRLNTADLIARPEPQIKKEKPMEPLTLTARRRFGFSHDPFRPSLTSIDDVLFTKEHQDAVDEMLAAARHQEFIGIFGEVGCGKTTCMEVFMQRVPRNTLIVRCLTLDRARLTGENLYDAIISDLTGELGQKVSIPARRETKARKVVSLLEALEKQDRTAVLLLDEAHELNKDCLRALKRLYELAVGFKRLMAIILIGQLEIIPRLDDPTLREVSQRCSRFMFRGLGKETSKYITHKLTRAGVSIDDVMDKEAVTAIQKALTRVDGRVKHGPYALQTNTFLTLAFNEADRLGENRITVDLIDSIKPSQERY